MSVSRFLVVETGPLALGLDAANTPEILPLGACARVPWAPPWVRGVVDHHGRLVTMVDLARFLGLDGAQPRVAVHLDRVDLPLAFCVSAAHLVEARDAVRMQNIEHRLPQAGWVIEALSTPSLTFERLDLDRVLAALEAAFRGG